MPRIAEELIIAVLVMIIVAAIMTNYENRINELEKKLEDCQCQTI